MKSHTKIIASSLLLILGAVSTSNASALTYQQDVGVSFTFNPSISVTLSSADLIIPNLAPGTASDSNIITVNVKTNNANGYTLNATVGNNTTFNTRDLKNKNSTVTDKFSSVAFGSSIATNTALTDNTWAYSYQDASAWSNYSGLPLYNDETNIATIKTSNGPVASNTGDDVQFKIAARAADSIAAGEYNNVINFTAVAAPVPVTLEMAYADAGKEKLNGYYKMQDMSSTICDAANVVDEDSQMQAIDTRDNKVYWIAKLRDGKCWMTQNLDHDIDTNFAYTPQNTDIPANWTPDKSTYTTGTTTWDTSLAGYNIQQSYDPGNKIWDGTLDHDHSITLDNMTQGTNIHYHIGNYYNWGAAVAMNDTSSYTTQYQDVNQSICPASWTLPKGGDIDQGSQTQPGSFQYLVEQYGWSSSSYMMENPYMWSVPLYFPLGGDWLGGSDGVASYGYFWSPVVYNSDDAYSLYGDYEGWYVNPGYDYFRPWGYSVRCVSR